MFNDVTKLLDRNFAIGYFFPAVIFIVVNICLFPGNPLTLRPNTQYGSVVSVAVVAWLTGVSLLIANKQILRFREGYLLRSLKSLVRIRQEQLRLIDEKLGALRDDEEACRGLLDLDETGLLEGLKERSQEKQQEYEKLLKASTTSVKRKERRRARRRAQKIYPEILWCEELLRGGRPWPPPELAPEAEESRRRA